MSNNSLTVGKIFSPHYSDYQRYKKQLIFAFPVSWETLFLMSFFNWPFNCFLINNFSSTSSLNERNIPADGLDGITFEQFGQILSLARAKQPNEEILITALKPLEEQKIYDDGEIGQVIYGGKTQSTNRSVATRNFDFGQNLEHFDFRGKMEL